MHALHHPPSHDPPRQIRPNKYALRVFRHPLSIVLIVVIMVAVGSTAVLGGELYARHRATSALKKVVECVAEDRASVSFGAQPMLPQVMTGSFHDISVETAGNQFREAKGMKVYMHVTDLRLQRTGNSGGTVGSLDAQISWSDEGIKQTLQDTIRLFGGLMTAVTTKPSDGTIELHGGLGSIIAQPRVVDGGLTLHVLDVTGFGFTLPPESMQSPLDALTSTLTNGLPTGIRADTVHLTDTGITVGFSGRHASIPVVRADPCFGDM